MSDRATPLFNKSNRLISLYFFVLLSLLLCPAGSACSELRQVTFIPQWIPQAQFAGYYMAKEKGFFKEAGLKVTILRGGPQAPSSQLLENGRVEFGSLFLSKGIQLRARGIALVNIGQLVQRSSLMLVAKKAGNIQSPDDMDNKKVGLWGGEFDLQPKALFKKHGVTVEPVVQGSSITLFLRDGIDVASAMWYNEYHLLLNAGLNPDELSTFFFDDYNLSFPEDGIYVREELYKNEPAMCMSFVRAVLRGWQYAFAHPDETIDFLMQHENIGLVSNRAHQRWMLDRMRDIMEPAGKNTPLGVLQQSDYERVAAELLKAEFINRVPAFNKFFQNGPKR